MKTVTITVEDDIFLFYEKVGTQAERTVEQVMSDGLARLAGQLALQMRRPLTFPKKR